MIRESGADVWRSCLITSSFLFATCLSDAVLGDTAAAASNKTRGIELFLTSNTDAGMAASGHSVTFSARIDNHGDATASGSLTWHVKSTGPTQNPTLSKLSVDAGKARVVKYDLTLQQAGFAEVECVFSDERTENEVSGRLRIGWQPDRVISSLTRQTDFAVFWKNAISELQAIPPAFETVERIDLSDHRIRVFEVSMRSHQQIRVRGWLEVPRTATGQLPVVIRVPGYGQNMRPIGQWDDMIVFSFNPRGHGNSQQDIPGKPVDFWIRGLDDPQTYYYKGSYLDCIRAVDFVMSRPDVDPDRIAVWGGSQGGGFAFATAALDSRVDYCLADIPFLCDWVNYFQLTHWPEMDGWIADQSHRNWQSTLRTLSYFDTMNLADRIRCPTLMSIGLQDQVCPPTTCFAVFNRIPGKKRYRIYPEKKHGLGRKHHKWIWQELRQAFGLPE